MHIGSFYYAFKEPLIKSHTAFVSREMHHIFLTKKYTLFVQKRYSRFEKKDSIAQQWEKIVTR